MEEVFEVRVNFDVTQEDKIPVFKDLLKYHLAKSTRLFGFGFELKFQDKEVQNGNELLPEKS